MLRRWLARSPPDGAARRRPPNKHSDQATPFRMKVPLGVGRWVWTGTAGRSFVYFLPGLACGPVFVGGGLDNRPMTGALIGIIEALSRGLDGLLPILREPVGDTEIIEAQRQLQTLARKVYAAQLELDASTEQAGLAQAHGYASVKAMLGDMLRLHPREAAAREAHREQLAHRRSLIGQLLPPRLPATAAALCEGAIGATHVEVIDRVMAVPARHPGSAHPHRGGRADRWLRPGLLPAGDRGAGRATVGAPGP